MIELVIIGGAIASIGIFLVLVILGWGIGMYNTFRVGQQDIKTQWSNIKTEYQRRMDLFYNLVQSVKSIKNFEKETYIGVAAARTGLSNINSLEKTKQIAKLKGLDGLFNKLMVVMERYPKLQANEQHSKLMEEIRITEDRINVARTDYNEIVGDYNKLVNLFPSMFIAKMFGFKDESFFINEEISDKSPKIDLE